MSNRVIHVSTKITTQFAVIDDEGNVVYVHPDIEAKLPVFSVSQFHDAFEGMRGEREKLVAGVEAQNAVSVPDGVSESADSNRSVS